MLYKFLDEEIKIKLITHLIVKNLVIYVLSKPP